MINEFGKSYRFLSNFWLCPVVLGDSVYPSVENAYQAAKFPKDERQCFLTCSPSAAKRLGKGITFATNKERLRVMRRLLDQKFRDGTYNAELLISTGLEELVEGNRQIHEVLECDLRQLPSSPDSLPVSELIS